MPLIEFVMEILNKDSSTFRSITPMDLVKVGFILFFSFLSYKEHCAWDGFGSSEFAAQESPQGCEDWSHTPRRRTPEVQDCQPDNQSSFFTVV